MTDTDTLAAPDALVRRVWRAAVSVAFWVAIAAVAWLLWPTSLGGCTTLTIVSGQSMEPTYSTGDFVMARCGTPAVGDVVVYQPPDVGGGRIIHRLIDGDGVTGWQVQGDNNSWVDPFTPTDEDVLGIARVHIPKLGMFATVFATPYVWISLIVIAVALLVWPRDEDDEVEEAADATPADGADGEPGEPSDPAVATPAERS